MRGLAKVEWPRSATLHHQNDSYPGTTLSPGYRFLLWWSLNPVVMAWRRSVIRLSGTT